jgi:CHAT domain-containing protein
MSDPREIPGGEDLSASSLRAAPAGCQRLPVWLDVCAGTMRGDVSMAHLEHAAECRDCAGLLAQANAILGLEPSVEERAELDLLEGSSPAAQQRLAKLLHMQSSDSRSQCAPRRGWNLFLPILSWGAAAACVVAVLAFLMLRQPSDATLLAEAYDQQRPSQLRLPGTEPGPLASPSRGSATIANSTQLLRLKLRAQQTFEQQPNDPRVRQTLGLIALVEHDGETARSNFEMAQALDRDLPGLNFDLASAYFELAESTGQPVNYARAIELYSQHLQQVHGTDPVALYNRGLCWERTAVPDEAMRDFQAALALEKDPEWRHDIQSRLEKLNRPAAQSSSPQQPVSADSFLSSTDNTPGSFERYLSLASQEWLPRRGTEQQIDTALRKLAVLGVEHNDHWMEDMLAVPESDAERIADQALANSLIASAAGDTDTDLLASARAADLYRALHNQPGYLRAAVEHLYALGRMGRERESLREAAALFSNRRIRRYAFLDTYFELAVGGAYSMLGDPQRGRLIGVAAEGTSRQDLPISSLRAANFVVSNDFLLHHYQSAWQQAVVALRSSEAVSGAEIARFQLLSALLSISNDLHLSWTKAGLANAAAGAAAASPNRKAAAYAFEELGLDDLEIGNLAGAKNSFRSADTLLVTLGNGPAARRFAADWTSDRALLVARTRGPAAAAAILAPQEPTVRYSDALEPRLRFYTKYADLLRQSHNTQASLQQILIAITDAEHSLSNVRTPAERTAWPEENRRAYELLVADIAQSNPALALRAWEWLQSAPYREGQPLSAAFTSNITSSQLDSILPPIPAPPSDRLTLVLARVLDHYILWSLTSDPHQPVRQYILTASPASISGRIATLLRLCGDPRSSTGDIILLGQSLYADLLAPADDQLSHTQLVALDVDPSLATLPFAALQHQGHFLGIAYCLTFLPSYWVLEPQTNPATARLPAQPRLAVLEQSPVASHVPIPADYDESAAIQRLFPTARLERATLFRVGSELALIGSPSLRSLLFNADAIHYVGHGLDDESSSAALSSPGPVLKLSAGVLPHTRLAVLAACQTLREREDTTADVPSFARVVMAAGAANVLATQWDVDSRMTSRLMQHFYTALSAGATFSEALRQSQQLLQQDPTSAHPYYWSGFQLVGTS